jgi:hypothetical protein
MTQPLCWKFSTFRRNIPLQYSGWKTKLTKKKEAECCFLAHSLLVRLTTVRQHVSPKRQKLLLRYRASHPRRLSSTQLPQSETLKSDIINIYRLSITSRLKPVICQKLCHASCRTLLQVSFLTYTQKKLLCLFCFIQEEEGNLGGGNTRTVAWYIIACKLFRT